jgi:small subunit ribosomal protein S8
MSDPIADLIIRIKNAQNSQLDELVVPYSNFKLAILEVMKKYDLISDIEVKAGKKFKSIVVRFGGKQISHIKRISKPGRKYYVKANQIPRPLRGLGLVILSTPTGVISGNEARKKQIGGELICEAW